jgi:type IV pilus assembly protein PilM
VTYYGLDIGTHLTKIIRVDGHRHLLDAKCIPTPVEEKVAGEPKVVLERLFQAINEAVPLRHLQEAFVATSISSRLVTSTVVTLPLMPGGDVPGAAVFEARTKMLSPPGPDAVFEVAILEKKTQQTPRIEAMVSTVEKQVLQELLDAFRLVRIIPRLITHSSFSLVHALSGELAQREGLCIIQMGGSTIDVIIAKRGRPRFSRSMNFGCQQMVRDIATASHLAWNEAERLLLTEGVAEVSEAQRPPASQGTAPPPVTSIVQSYLERIVTEVRRSLIFTREEYGERVETILLSGGGSLIRNLLPYLEKKIGGELRILDPFKDLDISRSSLEVTTTQGPLYANACGLAQILSEPKKGREVVNFIPADVKRLARKSVTAMVGVYAGFAVIAVLIAGWWDQQHDLQSLKGDFDRRQAEYQELRRYLDQHKEVGQRERRIQELTALVERLKKSQPDLIAIFQEIARSVPEKVTLTEVSLEEKGSTSSTRRSTGRRRVAPTSDLEGEPSPLALNRPSPIAEEGQAPSESKSRSTKETWGLTLKGEMVERFEVASALAERWKTQLERSPTLTRVTLTLPSLGKLAPRFVGQGDVELTPPAKFSFTLTAEFK